MCPRGGEWFVQGLASWPESDCTEGPPYVSTRVPHFADWIYTIIGGLTPFPEKLYKM